MLNGSSFSVVPSLLSALSLESINKFNDNNIWFLTYHIFTITHNRKIYQLVLIPAHFFLLSSIQKNLTNYCIVSYQDLSVII